MITYTNPFFREKPRDRKTYIIECAECVDTLDIHKMELDSAANRGRPMGIDHMGILINHAVLKE